MSAQLDKASPLWAVSVPSPPTAAEKTKDGNRSGGGNRKKDEEKRLLLTPLLPRLTIASRLSQALAFLLARTEWRGLFTGLIPRPPLPLSIHPPLCFDAPCYTGQKEKLGSSSWGKRSSRRLWALKKESEVNHWFLPQPLWVLAKGNPSHQSFHPFIPPSIY